MKKPGLFAAALLCALCFSPAFGQSAATFAPFVSRIKAELKNGFIRLTWDDSEDVTGPVYIYRQEAPFPAAPSQLPRGVEVPYGTRSYVDEPDQPGNFYYFVAASDDRGRRYNIAIVHTNTVNVSVTAGDIPGYEERLADAAAPQGFSVSVDGDMVIAYFDPGRKEKILYRSTRPIRRKDDLLRAIVVNRGSEGPLVDYPVPGIPYYYALVPEDEIISGMVAIESGVNAITEPVTVTYGAAGSMAQAGSRITPLPALNPGAAQGAALSDDAARAAAAAVAGTGSPQKLNTLREPEVFLEDRSGGSQLAVIVQGAFASQNWAGAADELVQFLAIPREPQTQSRARYYLGQIYYFTGKPREALFEFLEARTAYPAEAAPWIEASLERIKE